MPVETPDLEKVAARGLSYWLHSPDVKGTVFLLGDDPFFQMHLFPGSYTLMWTGDSVNRENLRSVGQMTRKLAEEVLRRKDRESINVWLHRNLLVSADPVVDSAGFEYVTETHTCKLPFRPDQIPQLPGLINHFYGDRIPLMRSLRIDIGGEGTAADAQVWMGGSMCLPGDVGVGVNMSYDMCPLDDLVVFVQETSSLLRGVEQYHMRAFLERVLAGRYLPKSPSSIIG